MRQGAFSLEAQMSWHQQTAVQQTNILRGFHALLKASNLHAADSHLQHPSFFCCCTSCHPPATNECSEPGLLFSQEDQLKYNLTFTDWVPGWPELFCLPKPYEENTCRVRGVKLLGCDPKSRAATSQLPPRKSHARVYHDESDNLFSLFQHLLISDEQDVLCGRENFSRCAASTHTHTLRTSWSDLRTWGGWQHHEQQQRVRQEHPVREQSPAARHGGCSARMAAWGGSRRLHSCVRKANNTCANARTTRGVFSRSRSHGIAHICGGSGLREHTLGTQDKDGQRHRRQKGWEKIYLERKARENTNGMCVLIVKMRISWSGMHVSWQCREELTGDHPEKILGERRKNQAALRTVWVVRLRNKEMSQCSSV